MLSKFVRNSEFANEKTQMKSHARFVAYDNIAVNNNTFCMKYYFSKIIYNLSSQLCIM